MCTLLQKLIEHKTLTSVMGPTILPWIAKKLSDLSNILEDATKPGGNGNNDSVKYNSNDEYYSVEAFAKELFSRDGEPERAFAELSNPLYEKVVCDIPLLMVDSKKAIVQDSNLSKLR